MTNNAIKNWGVIKLALVKKVSSHPQTLSKLNLSHLG